MTPGVHCRIARNDARAIALGRDDGESASVGQLRYWRAWDCDDGDVERIRVALSRGIVAAAISSGTVVRTHSDQGNT